MLSSWYESFCSLFLFSLFFFSSFSIFTFASLCLSFYVLTLYQEQNVAPWQDFGRLAVRKVTSSLHLFSFHSLIHPPPSSLFISLLPSFVISFSPFFLFIFVYFSGSICCGDITGASDYEVWCCPPSNSCGTTWGTCSSLYVSFSLSLSPSSSFSFSIHFLIFSLFSSFIHCRVE